MEGEDFSMGARIIGQSFLTGNKAQGYGVSLRVKRGGNLI
jgi:hypothetical protein